MKITKLAKELNISTETIKQFIQDFDLDLVDTLDTNLHVKTDFEKFLRENIDFLQKYEADLNAEKSSEEIATEINEPKEKVEEIIKEKLPNLFENGSYKSSVSSYGIHNQLGGDYQFVYNYFGKKTQLAQRNFIGYRDLYFHIIHMLNPIIDEQQAKDWGIEKPAGIILYGPKGSGKIFWARKISEMIHYEFQEVKKSHLSTAFINDERNDFKDFLFNLMNQKESQILFLENFHNIAKARTIEESSESKYEKIKSTILHTMHQFVEENLLMITSADSLKNIDSEVLSPGRFDIKIPVFPPNSDERAQMILRYLTLNLEEDSTLMKILEFNKADHKPFWQTLADRMKLFSNTMVIDFTQSLKKRLRNYYLKVKTPQFAISGKMLELSYIECASKLNDEYLTSIQSFIVQVSANDYDVFSKRIEQMKQELNFYTIKEKPTRKIGFDTDDE